MKNIRVIVMANLNIRDVLRDMVQESVLVDCRLELDDVAVLLLGAAAGYDRKQSRRSHS